MNALVPQTGSTALAMPPGYDPYAAYGEATSSDANKLFIGFKNGEYFYGQDKDEIPLGTKLIANMACLRIGFRRWENQRPVEEVMGLLLDGFRLPARAELGFLDKSTWEIQDDGTPRDPCSDAIPMMWKPIASNGMPSRAPCSSAAPPASRATHQANEKTFVNCLPSGSISTP